MSQRLSPLVGLVIIVLVSLLRPTIARSAAPAPFAHHAGFPRTELQRVYFSSPTVIDLDGDDALEVLVADSSGCIWGWNRAGAVLPGFPLRTSAACDGATRINGPLAVGDIDGDGNPEIVAGTRGTSNAPGARGKVFVWNKQGGLVTGWPQEMAWDAQGEGGAEVYSVALANVTGDKRLEVLAGTSNNSLDEQAPAPNLYAWHANGTLVTGYPTWYRNAGIWGQIAAADLTGDGYAEVLTGRDQLYFHAYGATGAALPNWPVRSYVSPVNTNYSIDRYVEYTRSAPAIADLDGDGSPEVVIAGKVRDPLLGHATVAGAVMVVGANGQRKPGWTIPALIGAPLSDQHHRPSQGPALVDLDGDGKLEIVISLFDGTIRAYRADGTTMWSYDYAQGNSLFASEPAIGDITGDGKLDIVFGTYSLHDSAIPAVRMHALNAQGRVLPSFPMLLDHEGTSGMQGIQAAPTLADLDGDCNVEILAASLGGTLYTWDLNTRYDATLMPWPTSRQNNLRSGASLALTTPSAQGASAMDTMPQHIFLPNLGGRSC